MSNYLKLTAEENAVYNRMLEKVKPKEREVVMQYTNEWIEEGVKKGLQQGLQEGCQEGRQMVLRLLRRRVGAIPTKLARQLDCLDDARIFALGETFFDFAVPADVTRWIAEHGE